LLNGVAYSMCRSSKEENVICSVFTTYLTVFALHEPDSEYTTTINQTSTVRCGAVQTIADECIAYWIPRTERNG
jgi:hypothetical protein